MNNTHHSLQQIGSSAYINKNIPELKKRADNIWYYNNIGIEELANDCGTLYIHNLCHTTDENIKWVLKFAKKYGYCVIFGTLVGLPHLQYMQDIINILKKNRFKRVGQCPSSRHPMSTKITYIKILQNTVRGYPE